MATNAHANDRGPRNPMIVSGAIREYVERLKKVYGADNFSLPRLEELCDELEQSLILQQFASSIAMHSHPERVKLVPVATVAPAAPAAQSNEVSLSTGSAVRSERQRSTSGSKRKGVNTRNAAAWFAGQSFNGGTR